MGGGGGRHHVAANKRLAYQMMGKGMKNKLIMFVALAMTVASGAAFATTWVSVCDSFGCTHTRGDGFQVYCSNYTGSCHVTGGSSGAI